MVIKNVWYFSLLHVLVINSMELDQEDRQLAVSGNTYETFTPRELGGQNDISSVASLHHSCNAPQHVVDLSLDLNDEPQEEITDLDDSEVSFLIKACKFTKLKDVSKKHAKAVVKKNVKHASIQKIISAMRRQKTDPNEVHIDHDQEAVRSGGVDLGIDVKDIHKVSYDLAGLMWKEDRTCCGHTISHKKGQNITAGVLTFLTAGGLLVCNIVLTVYYGECATVNNFYNCTYP